MKRLLLNIVGFKTAWLTCAFGAAVNGWIPVAVIAVLISIHLTVAERWLPELRLILLVGVLGAIVDSSLGLFGVMTYVVGDSTSQLAPPWLIALWMSFATVLPYGLRWLSTKPLVSIVMGAAAGPASYYGGSKAGAVIMGDALIFSLVAIGVAWALVMPLISWLSRQPYFDAHDIKPVIADAEAVAN
ncbi:MAG: DUF2878 domain-containing protein [Gammaproteobacteria bacterium]|nr:DUF2878 domain-containing protein [Gammaproteobacteria bacterium]